MATQQAEGVTLTLITETPKKNGSTEDDYDPHLHRETPNATSNFETLVHLLKCSLGTGILAMPQAFAKAGLVTGTIATVLIGILLTYCLHILVSSQYRLCKKERVPLLTYPESMKVALRHGPSCLRPFANISAPIVDVFIVVYQLGIGCVYIVFIAENVKSLVDPIYEMSLTLYMVIVMVPLLCFTMIRDLKRLAPFSLVANVLTLIGVCVVVYFLLALERKQGDLDLWGSFSTFPLFFGTVLFALTAVGVVITLENNMQNPKSFGSTFGVLNVGMAFIVLLYVAVGVLGYLFCLSDCRDSITLNLPKQPLPMVVLGLFAVAILISYVLQCYVPVEIVWKTYVRPKLVEREVKKLLLWEYVLRVGLCLLTFILAVCIPLLGLFISLFGALCLSVLGLCFPAILELCSKWGTPSLGKGTIVKDILIVIFGIVGMIAGTYTTMLSIVRALS
ncbi:hypothetical protein JYU34_000426 [Plutella xylostella]|uniref:Amino acid transporter transmembrane domain-containing protein n=2 Tax=Plutella xylostella TaxID=51655 RepID=A0ABQ7R7N2_PLUXY|nr:proton-coupled amino acid transporter-like protein CG1139 isoform X2 [Plutella xylostella]KAG7313315.1 hypothetical protein JYU34_000426 [Plutella xylostella]